MGGSVAWRRWGSGAVIAGLGVLTLLVHGYHLAFDDLPFLAAVFGAVVPMIVSVALVGCGAWLVRADFGARSTRPAAWSLAGVLVMFALASGNYVFQRAAGASVEGLSVVLVVEGSTGALLGFLLGVYDVQRLISREELVEERETATRLSRRLNVLNRVLRHDIRNKVNVIRGNADMVATGSGGMETAAETIQTQADEMFRLSEYARELQDVLGQDDVETEPVDVGTTVSAKAMRLRRDHEYATVHVDVDGEAWADANAFVDSAVENLLTNAVEHNDGVSPSIWVEVSTEERDDRAVVVVRIADDGPGIPPEEVAVLQRGRETSLEHASGLGLWLVHWIVTESGGSVSFEEREPRGSVVELTLPSVPPPENASAAEGDSVAAEG